MSGGGIPRWIGCFAVASAVVLLLCVGCSTAAPPQATQEPLATVISPTATPIAQPPLQPTPEIQNQLPTEAVERPEAKETLTPSAPSQATPQLPTVTVVPSEPASAQSAISIPRLVITAISSDLPAYDRDDWKHWNDEDRDCQNARAEVLIEESLGSVTFTSDRQCTVAGGRWLDPYTGSLVEVASDLDVDHLVPLANAHRSGGWAWSEQVKEAYANDRTFENHLIAVTAAANRAKGARGPEEWQPPDTSYHCQYARDWITVKATWGLTATQEEWTALEKMLRVCPFTVVLADGASLPTLAAPTPTIRATGPVIVGGVIITEFMANPAAVSDALGEWFEVYNPNPSAPVDINGWTIRDQGRDHHVIDQGGPLLVPPGGYLVLGRNADQATNGGVRVAYQYSSFTLGNSEDEIELVHPTGVVVDSVGYESSQVYKGASASLSPVFKDAADNDLSANWCASTRQMGIGDRGTPGEGNPPCS